VQTDPIHRTPRLPGMQQLELTDTERAMLIAALRRLIEFEGEPLSAQMLKAILERLEPQKPRDIPADASTG
jgi:hypothetical protein